MARLRTAYETDVKAKLKESLGLDNEMALPRLEKITVSCGVGKAKDNKKFLQDALKARRPIAQFKLREGMPVGAMVTLRGARAYEFLDRLISVVIPRIRDFRGLPRGTDRQGNYNMGIAEQSVFPEVGTDLLENPQGMNIAITIRNGANGAGLALLAAFQFPFRREEETLG